MANTTDDRLRAQIIEYADTTPEPPVISPRAGIVTSGCSRCRRTAWRQHDCEGPLWVCGTCGHVEPITMRCPQCHVDMTPPRISAPDRWECPSCDEVASTLAL